MQEKDEEIWGLYQENDRLKQTIKNKNRTIRSLVLAVIAFALCIVGYVAIKLLVFIGKLKLPVR